MNTQLALITGGSGGLGLAVIREMVARGARVILTYHTDNTIQQLQSNLDTDVFKKVRLLKADLTIEEQVKALIEQLTDLNILIHLVGGFIMGPTTDFSLRDWQKQININLTTTFLVCKYCLRQMLKNNRGRIVTIGSRAAVEPSAAMAAYCATKAGVVALTQSIAAETRDTNITANVILPSVIDTPANRQAMGKEKISSWVKPESIAKLIAYLVSEDAQNIRGAVIPIYGNL